MFTGTVKVKLSNTVKWENREIAVVELDFGKVNGAIINQCERDVFQQGNFSGIMPAHSAEYCSRLGAAISGLPIRFIEKLSFYDYEKIRHTGSAYVRHQNPQELYDQLCEGDELGFIKPAELPETTIVETETPAK
jgi:hypothetical protein